jgi:hypothetical protein
MDVLLERHPKIQGGIVGHLGNGMEHRWGERIRVNIPVLCRPAPSPDLTAA